MMTQSNLFRALIGGATATLFAAGSAHAALSVTNGDFETGGGNNIDDVTGWFDPSDGTFWHGTWQTNATFISPNDTNVVVIGSSTTAGANQSNMTGAVSTGTGINHLYQSIGTKTAGVTLQVDFQWGAPDDDPGGRGLGLRVAVYAYDGSGFTPDNNTDVHGDANMTLLDTADFTMASTGVDNLIVAAQALLDISGAAGGAELFLRFNNYRTATTEAWPVLDNVSVTELVPEPASLGLMGLAGLAMLRRRNLH